MSGISPIRRLTETDTTRINAAAVRFAARHDLGDISPDFTGQETAWDGLVTELYSRSGPSAAEKRLDRLWRAAFCRALGFKPCSDLTVVYGYVGTRCN